MSEGEHPGPERSLGFRQLLREASRPPRAALSRITIRRTADGLGIHNPARGSLPIVLFLCVWLAGWSGGVWFASGEIARGQPLPVLLFLAVWLSVWLMGGLLAIAALAWLLAGVERLFVFDAHVVIEKGIGPFRRRRVFDISSVGPPRPTFPGRDDARASFARGAMSFDVDGKTHRFGVQLDADERDAAIGEFAAELGRAGAKGPRFGRG